MRTFVCNLQWYEQNSGADDVIAVSAKYGQGVGAVRQWMLSKMPLGPAYYPKVGARLTWNRCASEEKAASTPLPSCLSGFWCRCACLFVSELL